MSDSVARVGSSPSLVIAVLLLGGAGAYLAVSRAQQVQQTESAAKQPSVPLAQVQTQPRIVFRNSAIGSEYGMVSDGAAE